MKELIHGSRVSFTHKRAKWPAIAIKVPQSGTLIECTEIDEYFVGIKRYVCRILSDNGRIVVVPRSEVKESPSL